MNIWSGKKRKWLIAVLIVAAVLLIAARIAIPIILEHRLVSAMNDMPGYEGRVGDVAVQLIGGGAVAQDVELWRDTGEVPVPFFSARRIDASISWGRLIDGVIKADVVIDSPEINIVDSPYPEEATRLPVEPEAKAEQMPPIVIDRFEVRNGEIHFRNYEADPQVHIYLTNVTVVAVELAARSGVAEEEMSGRVEMQGFMMSGGVVQVSLNIEMPVRPIRFDVQARISDVSLVAMNEFFREYADLGVDSGTFTGYMEARVAGGSFEGYVKPLISDLEIDMPDEGVAARIQQAVANMTASVLETSEANEERIGTVIEFSGDFDDPDIDVWNAVALLLRNAFIEAIRPGFLQGEGN